MALTLFARDSATGECLAVTMLDVVAAILANPQAKCALVNGLVLDHPDNSLVAAVNAAGDCGIAEGDHITNWALA